MNICGASARRSSPTFAECFLKPYDSSGLLWARMLLVALDSSVWKTKNDPVPANEVADGLQSRSFETCSAVCAARRRRDSGARGASGAQEFRSAAAHLQDR